jgi:hypothetical protein
MNQIEKTEIVMSKEQRVYSGFQMLPLLLKLFGFASIRPHYPKSLDIDEGYKRGYIFYAPL